MLGSHDGNGSADYMWQSHDNKNKNINQQFTRAAKCTLRDKTCLSRNNTYIYIYIYIRNKTKMHAILIIHVYNFNFVLYVACTLGVGEIM